MQQKYHQQPHLFTTQLSHLVHSHFSSAAVTSIVGNDCRNRTPLLVHQPAAAFDWLCISLFQSSCTRSGCKGVENTISIDCLPGW